MQGGERTPWRRPVALAGLVAACALAIVAQCASAGFTMTLSEPVSPIDAGASTGFDATFALDCQTALQWSVASGGASTIPVAVNATTAGSGLTVSGATSVPLDAAPCQAPQATETRAVARYVIAAQPGTPALMDLGVSVRATMPAASAAGTPVVPAQSAMRDVRLQVAPILRVTASAPQTVLNVTSQVLDFDVRLENLGNVPLSLIFNATTQANIQAPSVNLGAAGVPGSGPSNVTASFRFVAPVGAWTEATARIGITPQVQTLAGVLHGETATLDLRFVNQMPDAKAAPPPPAAALLAVLVTGAATLRPRRPSGL